MLTLRRATSSLVNDEVCVEYGFEESNCKISIVWSNRDSADMACDYHIKRCLCSDNAVLERINKALLLGMDDSNSDTLLYLEMTTIFSENECVAFPKSKEIHYEQSSNKMFVANTPKASVIMNKIPHIDGEKNMFRILQGGKVIPKNHTDDVAYIPFDLEDFLLKINKNTSLHFGKILY